MAQVISPLCNAVLPEEAQQVPAWRCRVREEAATTRRCMVMSQEAAGTLAAWRYRVRQEAGATLAAWRCMVRQEVAVPLSASCSLRTSDACQEGTNVHFSNVHFSNVHFVLCQNFGLNRLTPPFHAFFPPLSSLLLPHTLSEFKWAIRSPKKGQAMKGYHEEQSARLKGARLFPLELGMLRKVVDRRGAIWGSLFETPSPTYKPEV